MKTAECIKKLEHADPVAWTVRSSRLDLGQMFFKAFKANPVDCRVYPVDWIKLQKLSA